MTAKNVSGTTPANDMPREAGAWDAALAQLREWDSDLG